MDKRQLAPALALSRLVDLIDSSPAFVEVAKQSTAHAHLRQRVADLRAFIEHVHDNLARRPVLREEIQVTRRQIVLLAESIVAVADLATYTDKGSLAAMHRLPKSLSDVNFATEARSLANISRENRDHLIALGMLPERPDRITELANHLDRIANDLHMVEATIIASKQGYPYLLERARKTARALFLQVRPLITETMLAEWRQALHLGRVRGRALPGRSQLALPNPDATSGGNQSDVISLEAVRPLSSAANE